MSRLAHAHSESVDRATIHVKRGGAERVGGREGPAGGKQTTASAAAVAAAWPRSTGVWRGECSPPEGVREGRLGSSLGHSIPPLLAGGRGGRKAVARPAGWWPLIPGSDRFRACGLRRLAKRGSLHARRCPCAHWHVLCRDCVCHDHAPGGSFVFQGGTTPLSPPNHPLHSLLLEILLFPIPEPGENLTEEVSGVKLLD